MSGVTQGGRAGEGAGLQLRHARMARKTIPTLPHDAVLASRASMFVACWRSCIGMCDERRIIGDDCLNDAFALVAKTLRS